jgi:hypothetical protein
VGLQFKKYEEGLKMWSDVMVKLVADCNELTRASCQIFKYEDLILYPRIVMRDVLKFLGLSLTDTMVYQSPAVEA